MKKLLLSISIILMAALSYGGSLAIQNSHLAASFDNDSRTLTIKSAVSTETIASIAFAEGSAKKQRFGKGDTIRITSETGTISVNLLKNDPFARITRTQTFTDGSSPVHSIKTDIEITRFSKTINSFGTGGLTSPSKKIGSYAFHAFADPDTRNGIVTAWLTHDTGIGIFHPREDKDKLYLTARSDFGTLRGKKGEERKLDTMLIGWFDDARIGLESYADAVASHYNIKLKPKPGVYCTWYHSRASDEDSIEANTEFAKKHLEPFSLNVMQIDDQWQTILPKGFKHEGEIKKTGPIKVFVDTMPNYSKGMAHTAQMIKSQGMTAGIWFMPFAGNFRNPYFDHEIFAKNADGTPFHDELWSGTCIDASNPKGRQFIYDRSKQIYDWGYRYFKIDGMHTGIPSKNIYIHTGYKEQKLEDALLHDPYMTHAQVYREAISAVREAGPDAFILGCNVSQNMISMAPSFGLLDAMRIGPDNGPAGTGRWDRVTTGAWHGNNLYFLNGRVWHNDPDPVYVRAANPIDKARWMCSWLAVSGAMHTSSEDYTKLSPERLDLVKRCLPTHDLPARPVDLLESNKPRIWLVENERLAVVGLFNWNESREDRITYDMKKLGLDADTSYIAFDYWADKFIPSIKGTLDQTLPGSTCRILALKPAADHPQLISTSRNITQGLIDVTDEKWNAGSSTLSGRGLAVAGDPYELRIVLPEDSAMKIRQARCDEAETGAVSSEGQLIRVSLKPKVSGSISWKVEFE